MDDGHGRDQAQGEMTAQDIGRHRPTALVGDVSQLNIGRLAEHFSAKSRHHIRVSNR
jgi:hypothetical protein